MLSLSDLFGVSLDAVISQWPSSGEFERRLKFSTEQAQEAAEAIDSVFLFVEQQIESEEVWIDEEDADELKRGISEWESVRRGAGLDLVGMMRRRSLAPFILVPRHVHRLHGDAEKLSLLTLLRQAQDAFVFGVPFAAIALMRSLLESMLRDHYKAAGVDLKEMINRVVNLPRSVHRASLHKLRRLANSIMHPNKALVEMPAELERDVHEFLLMLRALIESAPPR
jgi:phosphate uptake regulator